MRTECHGLNQVIALALNHLRSDRYLASHRVDRHDSATERQIGQPHHRLGMTTPPLIGMPHQYFKQGAPYNLGRANMAVPRVPLKLKPSVEN